jgi:micrococcal nuclease
MTTWTVQATVLRVIDGDTVAVDLDLGWGVWRKEVLGAPNRIRILGIDTPERGDDRWAEARDMMAALLPVGLVVWVVSRSLDSFGRVLGDLFYLDGRRVKDLMPQEWWT